MPLISHLVKIPYYFYDFYYVLMIKTTLFSCMVCHETVNQVPLTDGMT